MKTPKPFRVVMVTDAWHPQVNGVVRTLVNTARELEHLGCQVKIISPKDFKSLPCPTYPEIRLALASSGQLEKRIAEARPDALHIATEGPLGWAARKAALRKGWQFTTAYHTRFPEYVNTRTRLPAQWIYAVLRHFHASSSVVLAPTPEIIKSLQEKGFQNVAHWGRGVDHQIFFPRIQQQPPNPDHPIFLYAGRIAIEKNIQAFLDLALPGEKWVAGDGPLMRQLKAAYPHVRWIGVVSQHELADIYSRADVLVFPSRTDTFGLVMAEAMACGLPVAAFPVEGPLDVIGESGAGVMSEDLAQACLKALEIPREKALARAQSFSWKSATLQFRQTLTPLQQANPSSPLQFVNSGSL